MLVTANNSKLELQSQANSALQSAHIHPYVHAARGYLAAYYTTRYSDNMVQRSGNAPIGPGCGSTTVPWSGDASRPDSSQISSPSTNI
jgi:hypothetical protein